MRFRPLAFASVLLAAIPGSAIGAPALAGTANVSPAPCPSASEDTNTVVGAFAYDLESPEILRFISQLAAVPMHDQKRLFDTVADASSTPAQYQANVDVSAAPCPALDAVYGATRARDLITNKWRLDEMDDDKRFADFASVLGTAMAAVAMGDTLPAEDRRVALLPFAFLGPSQSSPAPSPSGACADLGAHVLVSYPLTYPALARVSGTTGTVQVKVSLSETGAVRYARLYSDTVHGRAGGDQMITNAVFSAAASTYVPQTLNCVPIAGKYIFRTGFSARK